MEVVTVQERGWGLKKNGELLALAQKEFDVLLTTDKGIPNQQELSCFDLAVVILQARSNRYRDLVPLMEKAAAAMQEARTGEAVRVIGESR